MKIPKTEVLPIPFYVKHNSAHQKSMILCRSLLFQDQSHLPRNHIVTKSRKDMLLKLDEFAKHFRSITHI